MASAAVVGLTDAFHTLINNTKEKYYYYLALAYIVIFLRSKISIEVNQI